MIWLLFKNCRKTKTVTIKSEEKREINNSKQIIQELFSLLDEYKDLDKYNDNVYVTDKHFSYLSIIDFYREYKETIPDIIEADQLITENGTTNDVDNLYDNKDYNMIINNRCVKVTEEHLNLLKCPFTWDLRSNAWKKNIVNHIEQKYGECSVNNFPITFSFEKYISSLIISCGLFKTNRIHQAHDMLIHIWEWLDKLNEDKEPFYKTIRNGLKYIIMSTLCHVLYVLNKSKCRKLFQMIEPFNHMNSKSRATIYAVQAAVTTEIGGNILENAVLCAKKACDLDKDNAYWYYFYSVAMTAQRQYLNTPKSSPTEAEYDAIQHAIILTTELNPYFEFHRLTLLTNKILYHYYLENNHNGIVNENAIKQDFNNVLELIKRIINMEPNDSHLIVKCAKSIMTLPYFNQENIDLVKQIIEVAVNIGYNDNTVIQAIKKSIDSFGELINIYKNINEQKIHSENMNTEKEKKKEDDLENNLNKDLISIASKNSNTSVLDLIELLNKYHGNQKWKILAQICSCSILFDDKSNLLSNVEKFMFLIEEYNIDNSDIVTNHKSIFIKDQSKEFNLAELVCNEIKLGITSGLTKTQEETQLCLDYLTKIMEVCQLKSKKTNPNLIFELTMRNKKNIQKISQKVNKNINNNKKIGTQKTKKIKSTNSNTQPRSKQSPKNYTGVRKSKLNRKNNLVQVSNTDNFKTIIPIK